MGGGGAEAGPPAPEEGGGDERRRASQAPGSPDECNRLSQGFPAAMASPASWPNWLPFAAPAPLGRKLKWARSKGCLSQETHGWVGSVLWKSGLDWKTLRKGGRCLCPWQGWGWGWEGGWHRPRRSSAGAQRRAALRTVAHQALVGFEARQGLAAGDGGQGAAETQHGGRGVLPWGERVGEAKPTGLPVCELGGRAVVQAKESEGAALKRPPPPGNFPHFWNICHFQLNLDKRLRMPCTVPGTLYCNRQFMSLSPPKVHPLCLFIKHTVSTCSVPSTGDTENGRDMVPALTELTVWWGDRHTDNHKHSVGKGGFHVHSLPCPKEDLESSSTVWVLERKGRSPGTGKTRAGNQGEARGGQHKMHALKSWTFA